jgi:hypothetical protein
MSKYAGLLFPADRYHQIGPFRFPIYNDLVPGEARDIETILKEQSRSFYKTVKLAQRIAKDRKIPTKKAMDLIAEIGQEKGADLVMDYAEDIQTLTEGSLGETDLQIKFVTVVMRYRGEVQLPGTDGWALTKDWTEDDTMLIPKKILADIYQFIFWERDGWPTAEGNEPAPADPIPALTS